MKGYYTDQKEKVEKCKVIFNVKNTLLTNDALTYSIDGNKYIAYFADYDAFIFSTHVDEIFGKLYYNTSDRILKVREPEVDLPREDTPSKSSHLKLIK